MEGRAWRNRHSLALALLLTMLLSGCSRTPELSPEIVATQAIHTPSPSATASQTRRHTLSPTSTETLAPTVTWSPMLVPTGTPALSDTPTPSATSTLEPTRTAIPTDTPTNTPTLVLTATSTATDMPQAAIVPPRGEESILERNQVMGDYGRGFGLVPSRDLVFRKLGHTAFFAAADEYLHGNDERQGILDRAARLDELNGPDMGAIPAIFLVYEGAALLPNDPGQDFLIDAPELYQHLAGLDYHATHLDPLVPAKVGAPFMIFLDHQLGYGGDRPVSRAVEGLLPLLLDYPNLHFFFDPEFRVTEAHKASVAPSASLAPGVPVGQVDADDINQAQRLVSEYVQAHDLAVWRAEEGGASEVILGFHQFQDLNIGRGTPGADRRTMIVGKERIERVPGVAIVFDYDGVHPDRYGGPASKYERYREAMDPLFYPSLGSWAYPGIKVFPPNPCWTPDRYDQRSFTLDELSGREPIPNAGWLGRDGDAPLPRVIIVT
jgi:hypothetical protein